MYSYEDRIRAVKLYLKLGKRTGPTIRQLGYPTKNALKSWYRAYEQSRDLQVGYVRSRHKHSHEQKQAAVQHYLDHDRCIASTTKALGYPCRGTLTEWIDELHPAYAIALSVERRTYSTPLSSRMRQSSICAPGRQVYGCVLISAAFP